jgi:hypothetical protein
MDGTIVSTRSASPDQTVDALAHGGTRVQLCKVVFEFVQFCLGQVYFGVVRDCRGSRVVVQKFEAEGYLNLSEVVNRSRPFTTLHVQNHVARRLLTHAW